MSWFKGFVLSACLAAPLPLAAMPVAPSAIAEAGAPTVLVAEDATSETDKRAKAVECSKQADAKKLHGEARKKFRSSCKSGK